MQMEDPVLAEAGLRLAEPCPDGRTAHPAASAGPNQQRRREYAPPAAPHHSMIGERRASCTSKQGAPRPQAGRAY